MKLMNAERRTQNDEVRKWSTGNPACGAQQEFEVLGRAKRTAIFRLILVSIRSTITLGLFGSSGESGRMQFAPAKAQCEFVRRTCKTGSIAFALLSYFDLLRSEFCVHQLHRICIRSVAGINCSV